MVQNFVDKSWKVATLKTNKVYHISFLFEAILLPALDLVHVESPLGI